MTEKNEQTKLGKYLSPLSVWALSFGCAVGWGAFVMPGTTFLPKAGPVGTAIGIAVGAFVMFIIGTNYHYLMNHYPDAGGALTYATRCFGYDHGFLSSWFLVLAYVAIIWANASALTLICRNLFGQVLQFGFHYTILSYEVYFGEVLLSLFAILICALLCIYVKKVAVALQLLFALLLLGGILICSIAAFFKGSLNIALSPGFAYTGDEDPGHFRQILAIVALSPWAFVGFESVSNSAAGFRFPVKKILGIMTGALVTGAVSYILLTFLAAGALPSGMPNWPAYMDDLENLSGIEALPTFHAARTYLGTAGLLILGLAVTGGVMTGLIGNTIAASRLMYTMAEDGILPKRFSKLNRQGTPYNAILFLMIISFFILFLGRTALGWNVDVSTVGATIAYGYTSAAAFYTAKKEGHKKEKITGLVGILTSVFFFFYFMAWAADAMSTESYLILAIWSIIGFAYFRVVFAKDEEKRFGKSPIVWLSLTFLIFFTSLMWINQATWDVNETVTKNLNAYYEEHTKESLDPQEREQADRFVQEQMLLADKALQRNSILQMVMMVCAIGLMSSVYLKMSRQAVEAENRRMEAELEKERQVTEAKDDLLFHVSHDIRTPMNAIMGFTQLATEAEDDPELIKEYLGHVRDSGKQMMSLIDELLEMSQITTGETELKPEQADVREQLEIVLENLEFQAQEKGISFSKEFHLGEDPVMVDAVRLRRILRNLVENAVKYTPSGGSINVTARSNEVSKSGYCRYEFTVADTGIGMSEAFLEKIFHSFEQERTSTESGMSGTGLGLSVVKGLIDLMNGTITVRSKKGEGSTFVVNLPLKLAKEKAEDENHLIEDHKAEGEMRILLVEDIELNRKLAERILKKAEFLVEAVADGTDAVAAIEHTPPGYFDAVLMDIQMPVMNGYEATKMIRKMNREDTTALPIIALSANAREEDVKNSLDSGMNAHLAKPLDVALLLDTLKQFIGK